MSHLKLVTPKEQYLLQDAWTDFLLSRQAKLVSPSTIRTYKFTAGKFIEWLLSIGITDPTQLKAIHVRRFLARLSEKGRSDSYIHCNARGIKTFVRFLLYEGYIEEPVTPKEGPVSLDTVLVL
jgi:site-specific recombinase XerC